MGVGGDAVENLLYRLQDERSLLDHITINKCIYLMIGTNNLEKSPIDHIVEGIKNILSKINKEIKVKVILLPYRNDVKNEKVDHVNLEIQKMCEQMNIKCLSIFKSFTFESDYDDHVHFNQVGYQKWFGYLIQDLWCDDDYNK